MKILSLMVALILMLVAVSLAAAQEPTDEPPDPVTLPDNDTTVSSDGGDVTVTGDDSTVIVEDAPAENNYWNAVESWVKSSIGILLAASIAISTSVSTVKTILLAPLRDKTPALDAEIWNGVTLYEIAVLGLVVVISALSYAADINPFRDAPIEWVEFIPEWVQAGVTILLTAYLAVASHEFLDWLKSKSE